MTQTLESPYLTANEAAHYLRLEERTLNNMRWRGEGPHWRKHGGKVIYHRSDLDGWSSEHDFGDGPSYSNENEDGSGINTARNIGIYISCEVLEAAQPRA